MEDDFVVLANSGGVHAIQKNPGTGKYHFGWEPRIRQFAPAFLTVKVSL
jgi:hypothetical protein